MQRCDSGNHADWKAVSQRLRDFQDMGDCIMPREEVFARVIKGGMISREMKWVYA